MRSSILLLVIGLSIAGCSDSPSKKLAPVDANKAFYDSIKDISGLDFQPVIKSADSVQVQFYTNPKGDAKRYTRYYTWLNFSDTMAVKKLKTSIDKPFERLEQVKDCRSEGKFYFFQKGNPVQTVYFSNLGDSCSHLYFIADGWFYYMPMDSSTTLFLNNLKKKSVTPPSEPM